MKKIFFVGLAFVALLAMTACADTNASRVQELDSFVVNVEQKAASYDESEWQVADQTFESLVEAVELNYDQMTPEQQEVALKAIGRYYGLQTRHGIERAAKEVQQAIEQLPALLEGFTEAFTEEVDER